MGLAGLAAPDCMANSIRFIRSPRIRPHPRSAEVKFPSYADVDGSAKWPFLGGRPRGFWRRREGGRGNEGLGADMFRHELGVLTQAVARSLDLHHDGVMQQPVQHCGGDDGITEYVIMPPSLIACCARSVPAAR